MNFVVRPAVTPGTVAVTAVALSLFAVPASGQSVAIGADIASRYVWRGTDFGESLSVQPALTFSVGGFEAGAWASYAVSPGGADANENDLWFAYTREVSSAGTISVGMTDYYFPAPDAPDGFFDADAHTFEPYFAYSGPERFPVELFGGFAFSPHVHESDFDGGGHRDSDEGREVSLYVEAGFPFAVGSTEIGVHAGGVAGESDFYGTSGSALVNLGITATRTLRVTDSFSPPVSVAYILNPDDERAFLVFAVSLSP